MEDDLKTKQPEQTHLDPTDEEWQADINETADTANNANPGIRLVTDEKTLNWSLNAIRFAVFADSVTATILDPNYVFMAAEGSHKDSFESTKPFGFNGATYFLAMTALLGAALAATIMGSVSDRIGRKPVILICLVIGAVGAVCNYLARESFWGFCISNFAQGLFAASLPVAMAYVSDVKPTRKEKDDEIGVLVALAMLGTTGGGICAILMEAQGLFTPLFIGAALNVMAAVLACFYIIEPKKMLFVGSRVPGMAEDDDDEETAPEKIDNKLLSNVIAGALADNIGSAGLLPLAMSPLAFNQFYAVFVEQGEDPIMSQSAFKWISVMVALTVIPGAAFSQVVFDKIGAAGGCVVGNFITGLITMLCMFIAYIEPATYGAFAAFIAVLYIGFPFTVLSQLSTGPMLDTLAPIDRRGFVQGLNISVMNFATAIAPYLLGEMADKVGVKETMWTCIGISMAAGLINCPLMFSKTLQRPPKKAPKYLRALKGEDVDFVELAMKGEWVPAKLLDSLNDDRMKKGQPWLVIPYKPYEEDKQHLGALRKQAHGDFLYLRHTLMKFLNDPEWNDEEKRNLLAAQYQNSRAPEKEREKLAQGLSQWFSDYLIDSGYFVEDSPILYKQMIMAAFPPINKDKEITGENIEQVAVNYTRVLNKYLDDQEITGAKKAFAHKYVTDDRILPNSSSC